MRSSLGEVRLDAKNAVHTTRNVFPGLISSDQSYFSTFALEQLETKTPRQGSPVHSGFRRMSVLIVLEKMPAAGNWLLSFVSAKIQPGVFVFIRKS
jgi:hypothetical protein